MPSVIDQIKSEEGGAKKVYRKMVCTDQVDGNMQGSTNPRNTKKVKKCSTEINRRYHVKQR